MRALVLSAILFSTPALAIDFNKQFVGDDGRLMCTVETNGAECPADKVFTLRMAARNSLQAVFADEQALTGEEKFKRGELAMGLAAPDAKVKAEDVVLIKKLIAKGYGPMIVFQAWKELDPK